ncbi:MAG TPA: 2Fe-2S iron-sulfur cluster binding domain-containing protein [Sulfurimonas sp.]|nr:2Fe-2S iron-sulfur cluster binding domain-containing protein [Sulfurimonas sp.]
MSEMVSFSVDGQRIQAEKGALLLPVLLKHGIMVPHFCYHDSLGPDGNCRMCMVGIEGQKRPQIACDTFIKKDMVVNTKSDSINDVKRKILELELLSHPVDCPICDQAGECSLQDYYMEFGLKEARRPKEEKKLKNKKLDIGKNIILDQERCVLCARCTRFTQEITKTSELSIIGRGDDVRVSTLPGQEMQTPYAMNIIDLCPVGALTSKDFRFKQRVWFMNSSKGICHGCAKGCNIYIDHNQEKYKSDTIFRYRPRINTQVNGHFICDEGRLSYNQENKERLTHFYKQDQVISEEAALKHFLHGLSTLNPLLIVSPSLSLEELTIIQIISKRFDLEVFAFSQGYEDKSFGDDWLRNSDKSANLASVNKLGIKTSKDDLIRALEDTQLVINFNHVSFLHTNPSYQALLLDKKEIHFASHSFDNCKNNELLLPISSYSEHEGSLINEDGIVQRFEAGLCNDKKSLLELLHSVLSTPASPKEVWDEHLEEVFGFGYEDIGAEGKQV